MKSSIDKMKSEKCPQSPTFLNYDTKELGQNWNMRRQWKDIVQCPDLSIYTSWI